MVRIFGSHNFWPLGIELLSADDFATWYLSVEVLGNTVYEVSGPHPRHPYSLRHTHSPDAHVRTQGEKFALKFRFDAHYPISAPAVQFVVDGTYEAPVHPVRRAFTHRLFL